MDQSLTSPDGVARLLGSFWTETYDARAQAQTVAAAVAELSRQYALLTAEAAAACSRRDVHPYRRERWFSVTLRTSELNATVGALRRFGAAGAFGRQDDGRQYYYGQADTTYYAFPAPERLVCARQLQTRISSPGRVWTFGIDVILRDGLLVFAQNPLTDPLVGAAVVSSDGTTTEQEATLWLRDAEFDYGDVYEQHGFIYATTPALDGATQKAGVRALGDAVAGGTNLSTFTALLAAGTGIPQTETWETVELLDAVTDVTRITICTDRACYQLPATATVSDIAVGDVLPPGTFLSSDVAVQSFSQPTAPSWLPGLVLMPGVLAVGFKNDLVLLNQDVPLTVTTVRGKPRIEFPLGTHPADTKRFFDITHARGLAAGKVVGEYLQERYGRIPATINPLQFFLTNWLRGALLLVRLAGPALQGLGQSHLRKLLEYAPPHLMVVVITDLRPPREPLTIGTTRLVTFDGTDPVRAPGTVGTMRHEIRYVATNCE